MSITVVIPGFNAARFIGAAIESVLSQTLAVAQLIVVDDGSLDNTAAVVSQFGDSVEYFRQDNQGVCAARNAGLTRATGEQTLFLDADDRLTTHALESLRSTFLAEGGNCVVYGDADVVDTTGRVLSVMRRRDLAAPAPDASLAFFNSAGLPPSAFLVPTWAAQDVRGFDSRFSSCADLYFLMQLGTLVPFVHVPVTVFEYLRHDANMSRNLRQMLIEKVDARLAFIEWTQQRGLDMITSPPTQLDLLQKLTSQYFYTRQWPELDATLTVAEERGLDSELMRRFARLRRLPEWVFAAKDRLDRLRRS